MNVRVMRRRFARRFALPALPALHGAEVREPLFLLVAAAYVVGAAFGAIRANGALAATLPEGYLAGVSAARDYGAAFWECAVKYGKLLVIMWLFSAAPPFSLICPAFVFARGAALGFAAAAAVRAFEGAGAWYAAVLYAPQNLLLTPAYLFAAYGGLAAASDFFGRRRAVGGRAVTVLGGAACVAAACAFEVFVTPFLAGLLV